MNKPGNNSKISAFTLFEVMVSLSLTSFVIIVTILAYSIIKKQFVNYQKQSEEINQCYRFVNTLENDLRKSRIERISDDSINIYNYHQGKTIYTFEGQSLFRKQNNFQDTLLNEVSGEIKKRQEEPNINISSVYFSYYNDTLIYHFTK